MTLLTKRSCFLFAIFLTLIVGIIVSGVWIAADGDPLGYIASLFGPENDAEFILPQRIRPSPETVDPAPEDFDYPSWFTVDNVPFHSAILIAGSMGYANYRHQADLCHAYQLLKSGGLPDDQIITFVYDDIAHDIKNPYPGQLYNKPGGENVYPGCAKDYTGWEVNKYTLFSVLKGDKNAVAGVGSGRVLQSNPEQKVFVFYTDHGCYGCISMPAGPNIYADEFNQLLMELAEADYFDQMLVYLESCEAGSMFRGFETEKSHKILAVTAADAAESSYATYCPEEKTTQTRIIIPNATYIGSCLGDLFSVSWMEDTESVNRANTLVEEQFKRVKDRTSQHEMYLYGSHVMKYGDDSDTIFNQIIGNFMSYFSAPPGWTRQDAVMLLSQDSNDESWTLETSYDQRSADLLYLYRWAHDHKNENSDQDLENELAKRHRVDKRIRALIQDLIDRSLLSSQVSIEAYASTEVNPGAQVVNDWDCLRGMVSEWESTCERLNDYSRKYTLAFANFCNFGVAPSDLQPFLSVACRSPIQ